MHAAILEWVYAVVAARAIHGHEAALANTDPNPERTKILRALRDAMEVLRAAPTKWNAYKAVYDASWIFGHPGTRWDVRLFQKPTPEGNVVLEQRVAQYLGHLEERLEQEAEGNKAQTRRTEEHIARLRLFTLTGVPYTPDETVHKEFPVNLTGWRYGDIQSRVLEKSKADARGVLTTLESHREQMPDIYEMVRRQSETGEGFYDTIHVILKVEPIRGAKAYWQPMTRQLVIALPQGADPADLDDLSETLRHELQHFAQSYLSVAMGGTGHTPETGLPSRKVRTPDFRQQMSPTHPSYRKDDPEVQRVLQKWRGQGLDPARIDFHSLDDMEFHTRLADDIARFEKAWGRVKTGGRDKNVAIKLFTGAIRQPQQHDYRNTEGWYTATQALGGYDFTKWFEPSPFFLALKKHAPGKWRKAVSELSAAVL